MPLHEILANVASRSKHEQKNCVELCLIDVGRRALAVDSYTEKASSCRGEMLCSLQGHQVRNVSMHS